MLGKSAHSSHKKSSGGVVGIVRYFLSFIIICILGLGLLLAFRNFSGVNPLNLSPQQLVKSFLSADAAYALITNLLTFSPTDSISKAKNALSSDPNAQENTETEQSSPLAFSFAIIADPHKDMANLQKALKQAKSANAKFVVGIGDLTDVGTDDELRNSKEQFDLAGLPYYVTPGDHDLWDSRDKGNPAYTNFKETFGQQYQSFAYDKVRFLMVYNSDNYKGLDQEQLNWLEQELKKSYADDEAKLIFVALATPLFHPSSDHVMGKETPSLKNQASHLIDLFKKNGVDEVFAADTHYFTRYTEPNLNLKMTTSGATTSDRNPQSSRFVMVDVYEDSTYEVKETPIQ